MLNFNPFLTATLVVSSSVFLSSLSMARGHGAAHEHGDQHAQEQSAGHQGMKERIGDPYPLTVDVVSGASLVQVDRPVVFLLHGREFRFADETNLKTFRAHTDEYVKKADELIIKKQKSIYPLQTCVVSGEALGGDMGDPYDVVYGNRLVRFCCKGCDKKFENDSKKFIDTLDQEVIKGQKQKYPMATCVVSGEALGGDMGDPIEMVVGNRLIQLCCNGCRKSFEKNPARYIDKLERAEERDSHDNSSGAEHDQMHSGHEHGHGG